MFTRGIRLLALLALAAYVLVAAPAGAAAQPRIHGVITNSVTGEPAAKVDVCIVAEGWWCGTSGADGTYELLVPKAGRHTLRIDPQSSFSPWAKQFVAVTVPAAGLKRDFVMRPGGRVRGTLTMPKGFDADGAGIDVFEVGATPLKWESPQYGIGNLSPLGHGQYRFEVAKLRPGHRYVLRLSSPPHRTSPYADQFVSLADPPQPNRAVPIEITTENQIVTLQASPVESVPTTIRMLRPDGRLDPGRVILTDLAGNFLTHEQDRAHVKPFRNLAPGTYRIWGAPVSAYRYVEKGTITVPESGPFTFDFRTRYKTLKALAPPKIKKYQGNRVKQTKTSKWSPGDVSRERIWLRNGKPSEWAGASPSVEGKGSWQSCHRVRKAGWGIATVCSKKVVVR